MRNNNKKIMLLIAVTILISMLYLFVGIDFEIFEYQFSSRLRKFILIILVGAAIATSVVIFQAITNNRLLTPSIMGLDAVYLFIKVLPVFLFGIQSVWVTNVYLNFILTLITMVLFALILFQGIFKIGHFSIYFILLIGVLLGTFFRSITGFIQLIMDPESFLGLLTVNLAHELMKTYEHKYILIATICLSWISLFSAQWVVENVFEATTEMSILIDLIGGSYFIYLLVRRRNAQ
ncbi:iron chelate uptake ABC transporter family permease subunit [Staphylococcus aureus]|nr:iron chelate uptake ABC transporter family permease subunit [Staphylococcus aureus]